MAGQAKQVDIDWNAREWEKALRRAVKGMQLSSEQMLERVGLRILNGTREYCPVDTGRLRSGYQKSDVEHDRRGPYIEVGTNVDYAPDVEFGHHTGLTFVEPQPHLRPAMLDAISFYSSEARKVGWGR